MPPPCTIHDEVQHSQKRIQCFVARVVKPLTRVVTEELIFDSVNRT